MTDQMDSMAAVGKANAHLCLELAEIGRRHLERVGKIGASATNGLVEQFSAPKPGAAAGLGVEAATAAFSELVACRVQALEEVQNSFAAWRQTCQHALGSADGEPPFMGMARAFWAPLIAVGQTAATPVPADGAAPKTAEKPTPKAS